MPDTNIPKNTTSSCYLASVANTTESFLSYSLYEYLSFNSLTILEEVEVYAYLRNRYGKEANF